MIDRAGLVLVIHNLADCQEDNEWDASKSLVRGSNTMI